MRLSELGGFDTFNPILPEGEPADGIGLVYETLMTASLDEVPRPIRPASPRRSAFPPDYLVGHLPPRTRRRKWHDGEPVTAEDVVWSFEQADRSSIPTSRSYYANVTKAEDTAPRRGDLHLRPDRQPRAAA